VLRNAVAERGVAHAMFASGNSQLQFLEVLVADETVPWNSIIGFHMDEYVGIGAGHSASFARYMQERIVDRVAPRRFHLIDGLAEPTGECDRYAALLSAFPLDLCVLGIGENGHLAFNDPPVANFDDPLDVKVVELDVACRDQQVSEGHFPAFDLVPTDAITVTIPALLRARSVIVIVPEVRKAVPVAAAIDGPVTTACPASKLQDCDHATMYLEPASARRLRSSGG
jgi:glucosamine-6-phosphate deaminase